MNTETPCRLEKGSWSGDVDHHIVRKHDGTDIDPGTSGRHYRSKINNAEWGGTCDEAEVWAREVE